jgi:2-hydroxy-3-oxopropionate reductase
MTNHPLRIGFIGLGIMGTPMACHLMKAGHQLFVWHTRGKMPEEIAHSTATQCLDAKGVAQRADIVFTMVPDTPDVAEGAVWRDGCGPRFDSGQGGGRHELHLTHGHQGVRAERSTPWAATTWTPRVGR